MLRQLRHTAKIYLIAYTLTDVLILEMFFSEFSLKSKCAIQNKINM